MYTLDLNTFSILLDGAVIFTAPTDFAPVPQLAGELDEMHDAGRMDRATYRALLATLASSPAGAAHARRKAWQFGGATA
jgi:hypothetical protein